jgi:hypothetical protein
MTRPAPIPTGTHVTVDGWLATLVIGHWWNDLAGEWSYRIAHDRSRRVGVALFHVRHSELVA